MKSDIAREGITETTNEGITMYQVECPKCHTPHWIDWVGKLRIECFNCEVPHAIFMVDLALKGCEESKRLNYVNSLQGVEVL